MKRLFAFVLALSMVLALTACTNTASNNSTAPSTQSTAPSTESTAPASEPGNEPDPAPVVEWPFTDKDTVVWTRNTPGVVNLGQQYLLDVLFDGSKGTVLLNADPTSGGAVCVAQTYAAGGDGYTFYMGGLEMVIGDVLGTFDYSMRDDFIPLGMTPTNGAPNFFCVSTTTMPDVTTMDEFVDYVKAHPGEVRIGYGPNAVGEVILTLVLQGYGIDTESDVKWVISEGNDSTTNMMGGIIDVYLYNQSRTQELMGEYCTPVLACAANRFDVEGLSDVPSLTDVGHADCVVPSYLFLVCKNDIDPAVAEAINAKMVEAITRINAGENLTEAEQRLADHMAAQAQILQPLTIEECWAIIDAEYAAVTAVLGD